MSENMEAVPSIRILCSQTRLRTWKLYPVSASISRSTDARQLLKCAGIQSLIGKHASNLSS